MLYSFAEWFGKLLMFGAVIFGFGAGFLLIFLKKNAPPSIPEKLAQKSSPLGDALLFLLVLAFSFTTLFHLFGIGFLARFDAENQRLFLPFNASFWVGPLYFFMAKAKLYANFRLQRADLKHFIFPIVQTATLSYMFFLPTESQYWISQGVFFSPFYGNFERGAYIFHFGLYLYFSYRFIVHERNWAIQHRRTPHHLLLTGWLKRMVKVAFLMFFVEASFILTDYFGFKFFQINLKSGLLFRLCLELSLAVQLVWLSINVIFAWRRRL